MWKLRRPHRTHKVCVLFLLLPKLPVPLPCHINQIYIPKISYSYPGETNGRRIGIEWFWIAYHWSFSLCSSMRSGEDKREEVLYSFKMLGFFVGLGYGEKEKEDVKGYTWQDRDRPFSDWFRLGCEWLGFNLGPIRAQMNFFSTCYWAPIKFLGFLLVFRL